MPDEKPPDFSDVEGGSSSTAPAAGAAVPVNEEAQTVDLDGPATHEFHISKKTPWPKGSYDVEVLLNDKPVVNKKFTVN